ncbi:hypothetical protein GY45DRAFT_205526 [Cubamyces sp. BRFM 1775]|nr:hypothetical protein GY45DRAFT_205526 [Cubamyces sp. BRFM 1775]
MRQVTKMLRSHAIAGVEALAIASGLISRNRSGAARFLRKACFVALALARVGTRPGRAKLPAALHCPFFVLSRTTSIEPELCLEAGIEGRAHLFSRWWHLGRCIIFTIPVGCDLRRRSSSGLGSAHAALVCKT